MRDVRKGRARAHSLSLSLTPSQKQKTKRAPSLFHSSSSSRPASPLAALTGFAQGVSLDEGAMARKGKQAASSDG